MIIEDLHELFVLLLSNARQGTARITQIFQDFSRVAQNADVKEALHARVFASQRVVEKLDECFKLIREQPLKINRRLQKVFVEDFREELAEIKSPIVKELYVLTKASQCIDEYAALIAAADMTGHYGVGVRLRAASPTKSHLPNERVDSSETSLRGRSRREWPHNTAPASPELTRRRALAEPTACRANDAGQGICTPCLKVSDPMSSTHD